MIQVKYSFHTFEELKGIVDSVNSDEHYINAAGVLLQLYNPKVDADDDRIVDYINANLSRAVLTGSTSANIADIEYDISDRPMELNVTYFKSTHLHQQVFNIDETTGFEAGLEINKRIMEIPDARCMFICYSCNSVAIHSCTEEFRHHRLPVFGIKSGRSIRALNTSKVYGSTALSNGIVAVILAGDSLRLYMESSLGFKEIGTEMMVTGIEGDDMITTIDGRPATDVYLRYLNVKPNRYFVQNVCEFPLIFHRNGYSVARVPSAYGTDGEVSFTSDVAVGETFRLSYGNADNLLYLADKTKEGLEKFDPEAVFLFECGNRVRFLKGKAREEVDVFRRQNPEASLSIGYAELFISSDGRGGALNSALVAVGLSEDSAGDDIINFRTDDRDEDVNQQDTDGYIPFMKRVLFFLERTSTELDQLNKELGKIACTDQLTKIYNRWELENKANEVLKKNDLTGARASLIFMDIDRFKRVNDTYGHDVGDMVLLATVNIVKSNLKPDHVFGRWGGEEFVYILPDTEVEDARKFAENLRRQIDENCFVTVRHVTMSFGVTVVKTGDDIDSFIKRADEALYAAKENGRNQVVVNV